MIMLVNGFDEFRFLMLVVLVLCVLRFFYCCFAGF